MPKPELALIIPVFNEETLIGPVLNDWSKELNRLQINYEIHVYVAKSKDKTLEIVKELSKENNRIVVHDRPKLGHGPDLIQGYKDNSETEWVFQVDSDDEMKPDGFEKLWKNRNDYDILIGKRIRKNQKLVRKITSLFSRLSIWIFYGAKIYDVNAPYRLIRTSCFKSLFFIMPENMQAPNIVISGYASLKNLKAYESNVEFNDREVGTAGLSKIKLLKVSIGCFLETIKFRLKIK